jgi:phosphate transport system protein
VARETFRQELDNLLKSVLRLGGEVERSIERMVEAMETGDGELASREVGVDRRYKEWGSEIDQECMILQARQAPVAKDLRQLYTVQQVTNHFVRAGTLCEHICTSIAETAGHERNEDLENALIEMSRAARRLFSEGLDIFRERDIDRARDLQAADDKVDLLYSEALNLIVNPADGAAGSPQWRMHAALMVHYLERIADHGVDIGGRTVFWVTGERIESAMREYLNRDLNEEP